MKKYAILTSVLTLAACGGGSGGGTGHHGTAFTPREIVTPNTPGQTVATVDPDSGLAMVDINKERRAKYERALRIVRTIESRFAGFNATGTGSRNAFLPRTSGVQNTSESDIEYTDEEMNAAYDAMNDILVDNDIAGKTNDELLMSLALSGSDEEEILGVLGVDENTQIEDKIDDFATMLTSDDKTDEIKEIINKAKNIYQDFGREFTLTLRDAKFYHNSNDTNYYTFNFDENGNITHLKEQDGHLYAKDKNGVFENAIVGKRYKFNKDDVDVEIEYNQADIPENDNTIRAALRQKIQQEYDLSETDANNIISGVGFINFGDECSNTNGCIVVSNANYKERIRIETGSKSLGLKYSDFGLRYEEMEFLAGDGELNILDDNGEVKALADYYLYKEHGGFVGGYEDKRATPTSGTVFRGDSYVGLTRKLSDAEIDALGENVLPPYPQNNYYKGSATLTITGENSENLKQNLVADFRNNGWYKVTVNNMPLNERGGSISFEAPQDKQIGTTWQVQQVAHHGQIENMNIKHYGPENNNATEAVGFVQYIEDKVSDGDWTFKADITFGVKKD